MLQWLPCIVHVSCSLHMRVQDSNLALHSEGIKMTVAAEQPHFLALDDDALGTGVVIYRLQVHAHVYVKLQCKHTSMLGNNGILVICTCIWLCYMKMLLVTCTYIYMYMYVGRGNHYRSCWEQFQARHWYTKNAYVHVHVSSCFLNTQCVHGSCNVNFVDTELNGLDIEAQHCVVEHVEGKVYLTPLAGATSVNTDGITCKTKLTHGNTCCLQNHRHNRKIIYSAVKCCTNYTFG